MKKILLSLLAMSTIALGQTASVQVDANGTVLNFQSPSTKTVNFPTGKLTVNGVQITGLEADASTAVKGITKLSVAPGSSSNPIAVGDNDPRNTNARTPTAHAGTHASAGSDPVTLIIAQITGLQGALDLKAPLASPTFTGVPLAPTAAVDTGTTQIATTGFVLAQAANATPIVASSTGTIGTATRYARQDHVHPAQTSVTGNAGTATALQTARTINGTSFDGTANITVTAAAGTLTGASLASGVTASSLLSASGGSFGTAAFTASSAYATSSQGVTTLSLATPNVLYTTPVTFSNSSGAWTGTLSLNAQPANTVFAGPTTGSAATPTMRALVVADFPTLNQSTTGSAATLTTPRAIYGNNFDGSAALTQIVASTYGGTGNGFTKFSGPATSEKTKTLSNSSDTVLELTGSYTPTGTWTNLTLVTPALGTPASGVVTNLTGTASININGTVGATTPATGAFTSETFTLSLKSTTALATPSALSATQFTAFASATSGASIMGYGTTNDVSLMNRAGTVVLGVGPNTTLVNIPGTLSVAGHVTLEGITSTGATGTGKFVYDTAPTFSDLYMGNTSAALWSSPYRGARFGASAIFSNSTVAGGNFLFLTNNADLSSGSWTYAATDLASRIYHNSGSIYFDTAPNGTAGNPLTWTNRFTISAAGTSFSGTNTNNNAAAGNVGEYVSASVVAGSATALTTATPKTVTSISLTAGDWDVTAIGALTGASTGTEFDVAIGTTSNSLAGTILGDTRCQTPTVSLTGADASLMIPAARVSISSTTTYYLIVQETFTVGSPSAYGRISARRAR